MKIKRDRRAPSSTVQSNHRLGASSLLGALAVTCAASASVVTVVTDNAAALVAALHPTGVVIDSITVVAGMPGQIGTYSHFNIPPVTIDGGIVMSSGSVANLCPIPGASEPGYDPASPPEQVNNQMTFDGNGATLEFDNFGFTSGSIENFYGSFDVAAIKIAFTLDSPSPIKFDFIFGSVEFPYWTSQFTDAFVVFLDGTDVTNQICFDPTGSAIQVGSSFAGLETTADQNTAFSNPHGVIHHLTTTTLELPDGEHELWLEVGDVNDHILDSAVFIANLRAEAGQPGTEPTEDCAADFNNDSFVNGADLAVLLGDWGSVTDDDLDGVGVIDGADLAILLGAWGPCT